VFRVRKTWTDDKTQIGAFKDKALAIKAAKKYAGYEVYDHNGKIVWAPSVPTPTPVKPSGISTVGQIQIVGVKNAAYICDRPSSSSKNIGTAKLGTKLPISGSVPGWWEVVYNGRRAYVTDKFGKRV
jgi:hypothetical protein